MKTINFYLKLKNSGKNIFTIQDVKSLTGIENDDVLKMSINRMIKKNHIISIKRGLYYLVDYVPSDLQIANTLYTPSYISLESALLYYGIINQVPYTVTSVTPKRAKSYNIEGKDYTYNHINPKLFYPDNTKNSILIASKEKALIDTIYLSSLRGITINYDEWELRDLNKEKLHTLSSEIETKQFKYLFHQIFT